MTSTTEAGELAAGYIVLFRGDRPPVWDALPANEAELEEFLAVNQARFVKMFIGICFAWPSLGEDVEHVDNLGFVLRLAKDQALQIMQERGWDVQQDFVVLGNVVNTKMDKLTIVENRDRNNTIVGDVIERMLALFMQMLPPRLSCFKFVQVKTLDSNDDTEMSYHILRGIWSKLYKQTRPVLNEPFGFCAFAGCTRPDAMRVTRKFWCGGCRCVIYCEKACQRADHDKHKLECSKLNEGRRSVKHVTVPTVNLPTPPAALDMPDLLDDTTAEELADDVAQMSLHPGHSLSAEEPGADE